MNLSGMLRTTCLVVVLTLLASCGDGGPVSIPDGKGNESALFADGKVDGTDLAIPDTGAPDSVREPQCSPPCSPCLRCQWNGGGKPVCIPVEVGTGCSDGDCCTSGDQCVECDPKTDLACPDFGLSCTGIEKQCDFDPDDCSVGFCKCIMGQPECQTVDSEEGALCDVDPNDCTSGDHCDNGQCILGPKMEIPHKECYQGICIKGEITYTPWPDGTQCNDGNLCTTKESCILGECVSKESVNCVEKECAGSVACNPTTGECEWEWLPDGAECDDGDACTDDDQCTVEGEVHSCVGTPRDCDDDDPCTEDSCNADDGKCQYEPVPGAECEDGDLCTTGDVCDSDGLCAGVAVDCSELDAP